MQHKIQTEKQQKRENRNRKEDNAWIFLVANWKDCTREDVDMVLKKNLKRKTESLLSRVKTTSLAQMISNRKLIIRNRRISVDNTVIEMKPLIIW